MRYRHTARLVKLVLVAVLVVLSARTKGTAPHATAAGTTHAAAVCTERG